MSDSTGSTADESDLRRADGRLPWLLAGLAVFAVFFLYEARPVPEPNEQHYLIKAKHFWDPHWVQGDLFLESRDAHVVFYLLLGWPTRWMGLEEFAWTGRIICWAFLAWSWTRLSAALVPRAWYAPLSAVLLGGLVRYHNLAGEWIIGSFEAKMISYGLVFFGIDAIVRRNWRRCWPCLGAAMAFHVLVGGWATLVAGGMWLVSGRREAPFRSMAWALLVGLLLALCGAVPALLLDRNTSRDEAAQANRIHVRHRTPHHLYPPGFRAEKWPLHLGMVLVWAGLVAAGRRDPRFRRLHGFVAGALALSASGLAISGVLAPWPDLQCSLLRYYWFRLADAMIPVGVALGAGVTWSRAGAAGWRRGTWLGIVGIAAAGYLAHRIAWNQQVPHARGFELRSQDPNLARRAFADWQDACLWAKANTPPGASFLSSHNSHCFVWYAHRAQVATFKNNPQDAAATVQWWNRLVEINGGASPSDWIDSLTQRDPETLRRLGRRFAADYLITESSPVLPLERLFVNGSFAVYRLNDTQARKDERSRDGLWALPQRWVWNRRVPNRHRERWGSALPGSRSARGTYRCAERLRGVQRRTYQEAVGRAVGWDGLPGPSAKASWTPACAGVTMGLGRPSHCALAAGACLCRVTGRSGAG